MFRSHTVDSAPAASRPLMEATIAEFGQLAEPVARLAESPETLDGFLHASHLFESSTLDPLSREVVVMTIATRNGCRFCVTMHTGRLRKLEAPAEMIKALRAGEPLEIERLEALRQFTARVLATTGEVPDEEIEEFLAAGYTTRNALEVVLGIGTYTMSTFANRLVNVR
ncbi:carboxymuconolactone decarboxylase family protein [Actinoplanes sp. NPDC051343]|uniref:carboxymuconolactone decarboxylase family protein n=1 Tax=Actinoplanes sp. NPDC051343 TaxID=3363906 RepID=UPI0037AAABE3